MQEIMEANTICTNFNYTQEECSIYSRYWNLCAMYLVVGFLLYCMLRQMKDNVVKLLLFYMIIDMLLKPFLLSALLSASR